MLAKELYPGNFKVSDCSCCLVVVLIQQIYFLQPTMSHYFIRLLAEKGLLLRNYTQVCVCVRACVCVCACVCTCLCIYTCVRDCGVESKRWMCEIFRT